MKREDEMVGWHHQLNGHEFEQALGDGEGQGSQVCCSPWGHKEFRHNLVTEQRNYIFTKEMKSGKKIPPPHNIKPLHAYMVTKH